MKHDIKNTEFRIIIRTVDGRWRTAIINALIIVLKTVFTNLAWMAYTYTVIKKIQQHQSQQQGGCRKARRAAGRKYAGGKDIGG